MKLRTEVFGIPNAGSDPTKLAVNAPLVSASAFSLPSIPLCPNNG